MMTRRHIKHQNVTFVHQTRTLPWEESRQRVLISGYQGELQVHSYTERMDAQVMPCPVTSDRKGRLLFRKHEHRNGHNLSVTYYTPYKTRQLISSDFSQLINFLQKLLEIKDSLTGPKISATLLLKLLHIRQRSVDRTERVKHRGPTRLDYTLGCHGTPLECWGAQIRL